MVKRDKQFVSSLSMSEDEVSSILDKKIFEEKEKAKKNQTVESQKFEQKLFANNLFLAHEFRCFVPIEFGLHNPYLQSYPF